VFLHLAQHVCEFLTKEDSWRYVLFEAEKVRLGDSYAEDRRRIRRIFNFRHMAWRFPFMRDGHELCELPIPYLAPPVKLGRGAEDTPYHLMLIPSRRESTAHELTKSKVQGLLEFVYLRYYGEAGRGGDLRRLSGVKLAYYRYLEGLLERVMRDVPERVRLQKPVPCRVAVLMQFQSKRELRPEDDPILKAIREAVKEVDSGLVTTRIDELTTDDWASTFEEFVNRCSLVIIDLSGGRPPLEYELGYVKALDKPVLTLVSQQWYRSISGYARKADVVQYKDADHLRKILPGKLKSKLGWE
jgi:hypothetical protein